VSEEISSLEYDLNGEESLFEKVGQAGKERYGTEMAKRLYEELALSTVSWKLKDAYGAKAGKVPMLRHLLIFGPSETFKSQVVQDFREHFLPEDFAHDQLDSSTPRALIGSVDGNQGEVFAPSFTTHRLVQVEWDTLTTMEKSEQIMGVFYKALEDSVIRNDMVSVAKSDIEDEKYLSAGNQMRLEFPVDSVVIGVVHLESVFWKKYDKAFYNRWLPVFNDPPSGYIGRARANQDRLDTHERDIQSGFRYIFNQLNLRGEFTSVKPKAYEEDFPELFSKESPRVFNKMNVTLSCKAILEGHIENGKVSPTGEDIDWLKTRITEQYDRDYNEMWSYTETNSENQSRRADKLELQMRILNYLIASDGTTVRELSNAFGRPESTIRDYLTRDGELLPQIVSSEEQMTNLGMKQVYKLRSETDDEKGEDAD
jgi:hypothetical protein